MPIGFTDYVATNSSGGSVGYYAKFIQRLPTTARLAEATQEEVLPHWSGLGCYSRARNMHHGVQQIVDEYNGEFPEDFESMQALLRVGRSAAKAVSAPAQN